MSGGGGGLGGFERGRILLFIVPKKLQSLAKVSLIEDVNTATALAQR